MLESLEIFNSQSIIMIVGALVSIPISAWILFLSGKIFNKQLSYTKSLFPATIIAIVGIIFSSATRFISSSLFNNVDASAASLLAITIPVVVLSILSFLVTIALYLLLPKYTFGFEWKEGLLIGLVWYGIMLVVSFIIGIVLSIVFFALIIPNLSTMWG